MSTMAWKRQADKKKRAKAAKKNENQAGFPGLNSGVREGGSKATTTKYDEIQKQEVMVLQAIYGEDLRVDEAKKHAWKKSEPSFEIRIKALSDDEVAVTLKVVLVATYPKTPPLLSFSSDDEVRESTKFKIQKFIETQPELFAREESEMMDLIVEGIREILNDAAQTKAQGLELPSLEEERAAQEAEVAQMAKKERERERQKREEETKEEERMLDNMVQEELKRQKTKAQESRRKTRAQQLSPDRSAEDPSDLDGVITFDQPCKLVDRSGKDVYFQTVTSKRLFCEGAITTVFKVKPVLSAGEVRPSLMLKQAEIRSRGKDAVQFKKQLQALETQLETLKKVRQRNLLEVLDYQIDRGLDSASSAVWSVSVLTLVAHKGPLGELLDLAGQIDVDKARLWTVDLLEALAFLHTNGIVHQDVHPGNILLCRESTTGHIVPKLADAAYQRELHNICTSAPILTSTRSARAAYWFPPEIAGASKPQYTHKTDVWDFGIVFLQMLFGLHVVQRYQSHAALANSLSLSAPLQEVLDKFFASDSKKRPRAFDLISTEFLATRAPILDESESTLNPGTLAAPPSSLPLRTRRESMNHGGMPSQYAANFAEEAVLGKGGFGEVVKARNVFDQQTYAVKKISVHSRETLTAIFGEVSLLSRISHPAIVRYINSWVEGASSDHSDSESSAGAFPTSFHDSDGLRFGRSRSRHYDFLSQSGHPLLEFDDDDSDADADEADSDDDDSDDDDVSFADDASTGSADARSNAKLDLAAPARRLRRGSNPKIRSVLYICMEYCDKRTLKDLIARNLWQNTTEVWRLFRQILEGLVYIHGLNIVHRDLKPENIFIGVSMNGVHNVKIGDFGLATSIQTVPDKTASNADAGEMTRSIGTAVYVAPEVRSGSHGSYTSKVDMYSLGVMFFEMSYHAMMGMERAVVLDHLRQNPPVLPSDFDPADKRQTDLVLALLNHNPKERPTSADLLRSGMLPVEIENEAIRRALAAITDPSSEYYKKLVQDLFTMPIQPAKDHAWDMTCSSLTAGDLMRQHMVKQTLVSIFRRHGAVETPRMALYPRSSHLENDNAVQLMDQSGMVLQLPFNLMMGHARSLAKVVDGPPLVQRSFAFGSVFRSRHGGGQPVTLGEVDFDMVTTNALDLALKEAEVIKVLDEIVQTFAITSGAAMYFQLGHSDLLQLVFEHCEIDDRARKPAADILSRLNLHNFTWQKARGQLRADSVGISPTSLDELQKFDFRDGPSKAFAKLKGIFEGTDFYQRASSTLAHLKEVYEYAKRFGVKTKIHVSPLTSLNEAFYKGGIIFACIYDRKSKDVFAAGGRYDSLVREHRLFKTGPVFDDRHAVGFYLNWELHLAYPLTKTTGKSFLKKAMEDENEGILSVKRCDVLVASFDTIVLRSSGIEIVQALWANDITAELARDARTPEELIARNRDEAYHWLVLVKQDKVVKVKTLSRRDAPDADMLAKDLVHWLKAEMRDRDPSLRTAAVHRARGTLASSDSCGHVGADGELPPQDVRVLTTHTKSKKFNRRAVVEQAQTSAQRLVRHFLQGPIAAIETSDAVVESICSTTSLSDAESWRRAEQGAGTAEKEYVREIHAMLQAWRDDWQADKGPRHAFVYNFRTGNIAYYDLGA